MGHFYPFQDRFPMPDEKTIARRSPLDASVRIPGSKSLSNRAVLLAALARGASELSHVLESDDLAVMECALKQLGVPIERSGDRWSIVGVDGQLRTGGATPLLDVHASGTGARFLTAAATLADGPSRLDGTARMRQRPIHDLVDALSSLGARIDIEGQQGCPPLLIHGGGLSGGSVTVDASRSSQYVSALLQVAPYAQQPVSIVLKDGLLVSRPYVDVTFEVMAAFGVEAGFVDDRTLRVTRSGQRYQGRDYAVEPDASTAAYFFGAAAVAGGKVTVEGLPGNSRQADMAVLNLLEAMGCTVTRGDSACTVVGPEGPLKALDVDMNAMPDAVLAMAVVALFAEGTTRIRNVANLRIKESDRLSALEAELRKLGAQAEADADSLTITPGTNLHGGRIATYDDHRMAMAFSLAGLRIDGVVIEDPGCVSKSFPGYFDVFDALS